jgi:hypothetical protein
MNALNALLQTYRTRRIWGLAAVLLLAAALCAGWRMWPGEFFRGYWFALMFWMQLSIGSLIVLLLQQLTGGAWGQAGAPFLRAASAGIFPMAVLFIPVFFALPHLFPWTNIVPGISPAALVNKQMWLNPTAFTVRSAVYLALFGTITYLWRRQKNGPSAAGPALLAVIVTLSFSSADWMMSLQPTFYSSLYPFLYFAGAMVSTFAMLAGLMAGMQLWEPAGDVAKPGPELLHAFGKLLFASVLFWGYINFSQFIIVWTANLPHEAEWYVLRSEPAWLWFTIVLMVAHFALPFCVLLSQQLKRNGGQLLAVAAYLFCVHWLDIFWLMRPAQGEGFRLSLFDIVLPILTGAVWLWCVTESMEVSTLAEPTVADLKEGNHAMEKESYDKA